MNIQYYGDYNFKITTKPMGRATEDIVIWTDPLPKGSGLRAPQGEPHIVLLSHEEEGQENDFKGAPLVLSTPGEYAANGISLVGLSSFRDEEAGAVRGQNVIYTFESEDIHCAFLGALGHDLGPDTLDALGSVDLLFLPIDGSDTLSATLAEKIVRKIEPNLVIPMHYAMTGLSKKLSSEKEFCDAIGNCPKEKVSKLNLKKKDLEGKTLEVVLMERGS